MIRWVGSAKSQRIDTAGVGPFRQVPAVVCTNTRPACEALLLSSAMTSSRSEASRMTVQPARLWVMPWIVPGSAAP